MQRRHFEAIARIIKAIPDPDARAAMAHHFATHLCDTNPSFDPARFIRASLTADDIACGACGA